MNGQDQSGWVGGAIKLALSLAVLFPVYALLYITFPASIVAFYVVSAVVAAAFIPWDTLKKKLIEEE